MSDSFSIDFEWLSCDFGDAIDRATFAEIKIETPCGTATELEDLLAKTVRPCMRTEVVEVSVRG